MSPAIPPSSQASPPLDAPRPGDFRARCIFRRPPGAPPDPDDRLRKDVAAMLLFWSEGAEGRTHRVVDDDHAWVEVDLRMRQRDWQRGGAALLAGCRSFGLQQTRLA